MDTTEAFKDFLEKVVNLNKTRVDRIKEADRILSDFIKDNDDFKDIYIETVPQGSFRQKTITKPVGADGTFDVDLLIKLKKKEGWSAKDYHAKLAAAFKSSGVYEDITDTQGKTRCVTIDYEGDFHVDLVPGVVLPDGINICNKTTDEFELSDGDGYARWFESQDAIAGGHLVPVVRLLKYLRDAKGEFDTKSIILTTIAAMQIQHGKNYGSVSEALAEILSGMKAFLSQHKEAPSIPNPAMPGETFDRHWKSDDAGYKKLKSAISKYADSAVVAQKALKPDDAIVKWQKLFGDKFGEIDDSKERGVHVSTDTPRPVYPGSVTSRLDAPSKEFEKKGGGRYA